MSVIKEGTEGVTTGANQRGIAAARPTVVVISSNSEVEKIAAAFKSDSEIADPTAEGQDYADATDLRREQWIKVLTSSSVLKAWKGQPEGGSMHINRAPCAALALKDPDPGSDDFQDSMPEFEIADETYVETRESKTSLEREMTLKAFTESSIHAALSGGAQDIGFGLGGDVGWSNEQTVEATGHESTTAVHGFYNFPRVILHLHPDSLKLSTQCERFFADHGADCHDKDAVNDILMKFYDRFGAVLPCRVTLGGRLCTTREVRAEEQSDISNIKKDIRTQLNATIKGSGAGFDAGVNRQQGSDREDRYSQQAEISRTSIETQGGNGLRASSIEDWTASVASYRYWRPIKQDRPEGLLEFLAEATAGTRTGDQINALARHAKVQHKKSLNLLDISVKATHYTGNVKSKIGQKGVNMIGFTIQTHLTSPNIIKSLGVEADPQTYYLEDKIFETFLREQMREDLRFELEIWMREGSVVANSPYKLTEKCDVKIFIELEEFMGWGKGTEPYIIQRKGFPCVELLWRDIELNPSMRWSLPTYRRPQYPNPRLKSPPTLKDKPTPLSLEPMPDHQLVQNSSIVDKKSRNIFKKP